MRSLGSLIVACLMAMFASGCSTLYEVGYCWTLDGHEEGDPLAQQARDLKFRFHPTPAGVAFSLQNTGESDATIDWTQSYFLAPDGTSTPPLRTETLVVAGNKPQDAAPKSIIPRGATLKRFVALDSRAGKGLGMGAFAIRKEISRRTTKWSAEGGWTWSASEPSGFEEDLMPSTMNRFDFPLHYPLSFRAAGPKVIEETSKIVEQVKAQRVMVFGLAVEVDGELTKHRFEFSLDDIYVTTLNYKREGDATVGTRVLAIEARSSNEWSIQDLRAASGVQERKGVESK